MSRASRRKTEPSLAEVESKYFKESGLTPKKPRKHLTITYEKAADTSVNAGRFEMTAQKAIWKPLHWDRVLQNIREMRKNGNAPVDTMGCGQCPDKNESPEVYRFQTLVSLMLSSQTKDEVTFSAMQRLKAHGLTIKNILATSDDDLGKLIYPAGFWKRKVQFLKRTCVILDNEYSGDIPDTLEGLCSLPGVGPKMAYLVLSIGWGRTEGICVDTHVHRIANRLHWVAKPTKEPEKTRASLEEWLPREVWEDINHLLVGFGQTICLPVGPKCSECLNNKLCPFAKSQKR